MSSRAPRTGEHGRALDITRRELRAARAATGPTGARGAAERLQRAFPGVLGPGRAAAWRRYCVRRALAVALVLSGFALAFLTSR